MLKRISGKLQYIMPEELKLFMNYLRSRLPMLIVMMCLLVTLLGGNFNTTLEKANYIRLGLFTVANIVGVCKGVHLLLALVFEALAVMWLLFA